jgi:hypothetical protein
MSPNKNFDSFRPVADAFMAEATKHGLHVVIIFVETESEEKTVTFTRTASTMRACNPVATVLEFEAKCIREEHDQTPCHHCSSNHIGSA